MREDVKGLVTRYQKTEDDLSALQSVGQIIGDVLKRLDNDRFIVKASRKVHVCIVLSCVIMCSIRRLDDLAISFGLL